MMYPDSSGRFCPAHYHYSAAAMAVLPEKNAEVLYVIGGLYGNTEALETIEKMAQAEQAQVTLVFNGDFNWFNIDDRSFELINRRVLAHDALQGNVEAELLSKDDSAGCGCAYPESVDDGTVRRSNRIHALLKQTAARHPAILAEIARKPYVGVYSVGNVRVGVVHGDSESLAGWKFGVDALTEPAHDSWLLEQFTHSCVEVFACTHTCLPALKQFPNGKCIINNGSAGMANFKDSTYGLITRISTKPAPHMPIYGCQYSNINIDALPVCFNMDRWLKAFRSNWQEGSAADISYFRRMTEGADFTPAAALMQQKHNGCRVP